MVVGAYLLPSQNAGISNIEQYSTWGQSGARGGLVYVVCVSGFIAAAV
jgi:hypothetical protein